MKTFYFTGCTYEYFNPTNESRDVDNAYGFGPKHTIHFMIWQYTTL